ncbi:MAG: hypothetical protein H6739_37975 [Alphaproteobacteria bacterium]|nr:hypothetical protein [Alphaproteobacteria bacterium]
MSERYTFEGLESVFDAIREHAEDIHYLTLYDRTDSYNEDTLGRMVFDPQRAAPWLGARPKPEEPDDAGLFDIPLEDEEEEVIPDEPIDPDRYVEAACTWVREMALRNMVGEEWGRFRVRLYGAKGYQKLGSARFTVRDTRHNEPEATLAPVETPTALVPKAPSLPQATLRVPEGAELFDQREREVMLQGMQKLGDLYAQYGQRMLDAAGQIQDINTSNLTQVNRQLSDSREQVDQLVAAILEFRVAQVDGEQQREADARQDQARSELAREALQQLGEAARAVVVAQGMPPQMKEVMVALSSSPELLAALQDPDVRALMQDRQNLSALAQMLHAAGQQARAQRQAPPPPPAPQPAAE